MADSDFNGIKEVSLKTNIGVVPIPTLAYTEYLGGGGNVDLSEYLKTVDANQKYFTQNSASSIIGELNENPFAGKTTTINIGGIEKNTQFTDKDTILSVINKLLFPTIPITFADTAIWDKTPSSFNRMGNDIDYFKSIQIKFTKGSSNIQSIEINNTDITGFTDSSATYSENDYRTFVEDGSVGDMTKTITIPITIMTVDDEVYSKEYSKTYTFKYVKPKINTVSYSGSDYNYGVTGTLNIVASATVTKGTNNLQTNASLSASRQITTTDDSTTLSGFFTATDIKNQSTTQSYSKTVYCKYPYYIGLLKQGDEFETLSITSYKKSSELKSTQTFSDSWSTSSHVVFAFHERFNIDNVKIVDANNAIATSAFTKLKERTIGDHKYNILYLTIPAIAQETVSYTLTGLTLTT